MITPKPQRKNNHGSTEDTEEQFGQDNRIGRMKVESCEQKKTEGTEKRDLPLDSVSFCSILPVNLDDPVILSNFRVLRGSSF
jgi:hypothetical protein